MSYHSSGTNSSVDIAVGMTRGNRLSHMPWERCVLRVRPLQVELNIQFGKSPPVLPCHTWTLRWTFSCDSLYTPFVRRSTNSLVRNFHVRWQVARDPAGRLRLSDHAWLRRHGNDVLHTLVSHAVRSVLVDAVLLRLPSWEMNTKIPEEWGGRSPVSGHDMQLRIMSLSAFRGKRSGQGEGLCCPLVILFCISDGVLGKFSNFIMTIVVSCTLSQGL